MIRINLLGVERQKARKSFSVDLSAQTSLVCSLVLVVAVAGIGWWYWSLRQQSTQVDQDIVTAQEQVASVRSILTEVQQFEQRQTQLQQRVALIQQLRRGQSVPVQLLDHVSRSLPDALWLTSFEGSGADVTIEGRSTTLIALSDFVGNLGNSTLIKKPIQIVNSQVEASGTPSAGAAEVIRFTVKATLADPGPVGAVVKR